MQPNSLNAKGEPLLLSTEQETTAPAGELFGPRRAALFDLAQRLCNEYGWNWRGRPRTAALLSILLSGACERSIAFQLAHPEKDNTKFDPYYGQKSVFATTVIVDHLKESLWAAGYKVGLATEVADATGLGTFDVVIDATGNPCIVLQAGKPVVRLELKGSLGLDLSQIGRYLINPTSLVLIRVRLGQVALLRPSDLQEYVDFQISLLISKAERLLRGDPIMVPGPGCHGCADLACPYRETKRATGPRLVTMNEADFEDDIGAFYAHLPRICSRTSEVVLNELRSVSGVARH